MGGIKLSESKLTPLGLQYDRRYMLVDVEGKFLTQRELPIMALFSTKMTKRGLQVTFQQSSIDIPFHGEDWQNISKKVQVWKSSVTALLAPEAINDWFSERLSIECFLAYMPNSTTRSVPPHYAGPGHKVSFADGYPMLLVNEVSLVDLNDRMEQKVLLNRFRPNLVFSGKNAWEEDEWTGFSIGHNKFKCAKPCARCPIVNTNQETATRTPEVLKTMAGFRKKGNKVLFGINLVWENFQEAEEDIIRVGDILNVSK